MSADAKTVVSARYPRLTRTARAWAGGWTRLGEQMEFYVQALACHSHHRCQIQIGDIARRL